MNETIDKPAEELAEGAPKVLTLKVDPDKIGGIIGPGGKTVKAISEKANVKVNIENDGTITIYSDNQTGANEAEAMIKGIAEEPEVGTIYQGVVKRIMDFGAFIEIMPGKEGLCHISKMSKKRINSVNEVMEMGQEVPVKLIEIDRMGRLNLSYIDAIEDKSGE